MYLLTSDLCYLRPKDAKQEPEIFRLIVDCNTSVRRMGDSQLWKVYTAQEHEQGLLLTVRPAYCKKTSKKFRLGTFILSCFGFKRIGNKHLASNYRDENNRLRTLIVTVHKHLTKDRKMLIKEVFTT